MRPRRADPAGRGGARAAGVVTAGVRGAGPRRRRGGGRDLRPAIAVVIVAARSAFSPARRAVRAIRSIARGRRRRERPAELVLAAGARQAARRLGARPVDRRRRRFAAPARRATARRRGRPSAASSLAARASELVALEPKGGVRWTLARPDVRSPAWGGLRDDTRIAYLAGTAARRRRRRHRRPRAARARRRTSRPRGSRAASTSSRT